MNGADIIAAIEKRVEKLRLDMRNIRIKKIVNERDI